MIHNCIYNGNDKGFGSKAADHGKITLCKCNKHPKHSKMSEFQMVQETNSPYRFSFLVSHTLTLEGMISHRHIHCKNH